MASSKWLLSAVCVVALLAVRSESHGLGDLPSASGETPAEMQNFFKPEAAVLPESLDGSSSSMAAKPEATVIPTTTATADTYSAATAGTVPRSSSGTPRRSVSVAAGVACGVAAVAVVGIAAAVAYVVRGRRGRAVQLGSSL